jgi:hypothetical protein
VQVIALMAVSLTLGLASACSGCAAIAGYGCRLTLAEEAAHTGCTQADLLAWRGLRIAVAHLDEAGRPNVVPKRTDA